MASGTSERDAWLAETLLQAADAADIGIVVATENPPKSVFASPAAGRLFRCSSSELLERDSLPLHSLVSRTDFSGPFSTYGGLPQILETSVPRPDGTQAFLQAGLAPIRLGASGGIALFLSDVTEQHLAFETLRKSEERLRSVVESIPEAIFITEGTTITYANAAFLQMFEVPARNPATSLDVLSFIHPDDTARFQGSVDGLSPGEPAHSEYRMTTADGRKLTLETSALAVDVDGKRAVLWIGQDVTQRKELEVQLLASDRLAVLGTLAAGMAHSINNPLSYLLLNLEHVSRRLGDLHVQRDYYSEARVRLAEAHDGAERVAKVVRQMRSLSRAKTSAPGPVDVRAVIDNVVAMIGNEIRYRGQLTVRFKASPRVWAREGELEQAFLGLLLYVARSLPEQGESEREIVLTTAIDESHDAVVTVSDEQLIISAETSARAFDPFASGEAAGLSLAMCQAVITSLDGHLEIESSPDTGTIFRVTLPEHDTFAAAESRRSLPPLRSVAPAASTSARVLVLDDDPGVASTLRAMLETHHEVTSVESAREGLRLLLGKPEFDVVFCDLVMPEISGIDLYHSLERARSPHVDRIIFMTGGVFTPEAERFLASVPNLRIEKPFSLTRVEQLLAHATTKKTTTTR